MALIDSKLTENQAQKEHLQVTVAKRFAQPLSSVTGQDRPSAMVTDRISEN